ncbi:Josephin-domain-containing protein [Lactifluus subvellereus]|nr:Josephin-domain-containing protein [Lactifluus subvellereus]
MADLETLADRIYHEKQEHGSALCAQHALNSLLQGNYFTPSDLSALAQSVDSLERSVDRGPVGRASANMDDTGFFSVQVLENALNVWSQSLIRWRSEAMQPYHDQPQRQRAFILNCDQHWFTLRRFGNSEGVGPWFNLNSSLNRPEWISETYLGMVLQQAEADGYSTFAVVPTDPDHPLPQSDADVIAANLSRQTSSGARSLSTLRSPGAPAGIEDEDYELQAALHASLDGEKGQLPWTRDRVGPSAAVVGAGPSTSGASLNFPPSSLFASPPPIPPPSSRPAGQPVANPVATSMARNQAMLERMRREQEAALREHYHDEVSHLDGRGDRSFPAARFGVEDEDEQLRRAIAESEAMAREEGNLQAGKDVAGTRANVDSAQEREWPQGLIHGGRVYDDEDAELQAALQASLETAPPEIHSSDTTPRDSTFTAASTARPRADHQAAALESDDDGSFDDDSERDTATEETMSDTPAEPQGEDLSIEEMRRRRLERFGT